MQKQLVNTIFSRVASTTLNFLVALMIARHSGPAIKGETTLVTTVIFFFVFFSNVLGGQVLVYLLPRNSASVLLLPAILWSLLISVAGYVFLLVTHLLPENYILFVSFLSWIAALISIQQALLLAQQRLQLANLLSLVPLALQVAGIALCFKVFNVHDVWAYLYATLVAYLLTHFLSIVVLWKDLSNMPFRFSWADVKSSFSYGFQFQLVEILQLLNLRYYFFQLGLQQGTQYLGIYSIGISILEAVWVLPRSINTVHYINTANSKELQQEAERTLLLCRVSLVLSALAVGVFFLVPNSVFTTVFGHGFSEVKHSVRYLGAGIVMYGLVHVISAFYLGIAHYKPLIISNLLGFLSVVVFGYLLIPTYVMSGAGLAATASFTVCAAVLLIFFLKTSKMPVTALLPKREDAIFFNTLVKTIFTKR